jgi:PAS domain S-box-containing protein
MLAFSTAIKVFALASYLVLALLTLRSAADRRVRVFFSIYLFGMLSWQLGSVAVNFAKEPESAIVLYSLMIASSGTYTILFFPFTRALLGIGKQKILTGFAYATCILQFLTAIAGMQVKSVTFGRGGYWVPVYGERIMYALSALSFAFWGFGLANLIRGFAREKSPVQRNRIVYILLGATVTIIGAATNLTRLKDYPVDISANLASALIIGYAVVRHRLMDIRLILARSLFYSVLTALLIAGYVGLIFGFERLVQAGVGYADSAYGIVAIIVLGLLFLPVRNVLQKLIDKVFFREKEDYQKATQVFSRKVASLYEEEAILSLVCETAAGAVRTTFVAILLQDPASASYRVRKVCGKDVELARRMREELDSPLSRWLRKEGKALVREEALLDPVTRPLVEDPAALFASTTASLVVPVLLEERLFGLIVLGQKLSGVMYNREDLSFLSTMANQAATALDKSGIFLKIRRRLSEQTLLFVLSEKFRSSADFDSVMNSIVQVLKSFLNCEYCAVVYFDKAHESRTYALDRLSDRAAQLSSRAWAETSGEVEGFDRTALRARIAALAALEGDLDPREVELIAGLAYRPLFDAGKLLGLMAISDRTAEGAGYEEENELLRTIVAIISQGIVLYRTIVDLLNLESYNEKILNSLNDMGDTLVILDQEGRIKKVNKATCKLLDYAEEALVGQPMAGFIGDDGGILSPEGLREMMKNRPVSNRELSYKTRAGALVPMLFSGSAMTGEDGRSREIIGIARDMTERRRAEDAAKNLLLVQEIHHRIKNNLQVISSLLYLQAGYVQDEKVKEMFKESQNRVRSMALIHEKLYRSETPSAIDFSEYVSDLSRSLLASYRLPSSKVGLEIEVSKITLGMDTAVPCGFIINELVSNAFKHAFPGDRTGRIVVKLRTIEAPEAADDGNPGARHYELRVEDNGIGFPEVKDLGTLTSLGLRIVTTLTRQLHGNIEIEREGGTSFIIRFKELL